MTPRARAYHYRPASESGGITKNQIIEQLSKSPHGALSEYVPIGTQAAIQEPEFFAHLIAWNAAKGQIRDSKVALPVISLPHLADELLDNSLAHLALLSPRDLLRAVRFSKSLAHGNKAIARLVVTYLRSKESVYGKWQRTALQHRRSLKELYALLHIKPSEMADRILFKGYRPPGSLFEAVAALKHMTPTEAAGTILNMRIPFLIALGALGPKAKEPDLVLALINRMSPTELVTNSKLLERLGIKTVPALRAAYAKAIEKAASSKQATLKTTRAAEALTADDSEDNALLAARLRDLQEKQIDKLGGVEGNWLVLGDKSGSMREAIEISRQVAGTLARMVKGQVHLVFFDTSPRYLDATGKTYEQILAQTSRIEAAGGTSIGCGLLALIERKLEVDGIVIVSDGGENSPPFFPDIYAAWSQQIGRQVPVYLYRTRGENNSFSYAMKCHKLDLQEFDLTAGVDYYSLPNLVATMRTSRYSLADEIMEFPLLKLEDVLNAKNTKETAHVGT